MLGRGSRLNVARAHPTHPPREKMSSVLDRFKKLLRISEDETKLTDAESKRLQRFQVLEEINQYVGKSMPSVVGRVRALTLHVRPLANSGAFSKVFRGIDKVTGQEVAIKKTDKTSLKTKQVRGRQAGWVEGRRGGLKAGRQAGGRAGGGAGRRA